MATKRRALWGGFDYTAGVAVILPRVEWAELIARAARTARIDGDLLLFDRNGRPTHEVYDRKPK